jgi:hypothetical protein
LFIALTIQDLPDNPVSAKYAETCIVISGKPSAFSVNPVKSATWYFSPQRETGHLLAELLVGENLLQGM